MDHYWLVNFAVLGSAVALAVAVFAFAEWDRRRHDREFPPRPGER